MSGYFRGAAQSIAAQVAASFAALAVSSGAGAVGFQQTAAGAVATNIGAKLGEHVSVFDFIDDAQKGYVLARDVGNINPATVRAAVQKCLDAVASGAPLRTRRVYFPGGLYLADQYLWLYPRLELFGDGAATVLRNVNDGTVSSTYQGVFAQGYYATPGVDDVGGECTNNSYPVNALAAAGVSTFRLTNLADAANFAVDQVIFLHNGVEAQYGAGQAKTRQELETRRVTAVNQVTGDITLDRPTAWAHAACYATISGKAGIRSGLNEPAGHKMQILDRLYIHDMRLEWSGFNGLPGAVYDSVFERVESDGRFGWSVNFAFSTQVRACTFTCASYGLELAMGNGNLFEGNTVYCDSARTHGGAIAGWFGLLCAQGSRNNVVRGNRLFTNTELQPIFDGGSGAFGATQDNEFCDNICVRTSTAAAASYGNITLVNSTGARVLRNTFVGGNKFGESYNAAAGFEVADNKHFAPLVVPEQAHNFQAAGAGCSGYIRDNEYDGAFTFDLNGLGAGNLDVVCAENWYRGTVTVPSSHPNFFNPRYGNRQGWVKASNTYTPSDTTEQTVFSHSIVAQAKKYNRWDAELIIDDTMAPAADKTLRLYDGATLLGTLALPSAFGQARSVVQLEVSSINDVTLRFVLTVTRFPLGAPGAASVLGWFTTRATSAATAHQPKITLQSPANSTSAVTGVQLKKTGCDGGAWTA